MASSHSKLPSQDLLSPGVGQEEDNEAAEAVEAAQAAAAAEDEEEDESTTNTEMPMTMAASVMLEHLPRDAHRALSEAGGVGVDRITIHLQALPNTPRLKQPRFRCDARQQFEYVVRFLRRRLRVPEQQGVCCYVNSVFAPGLDEGIGNLWRCFKIGDELVVHYSLTQAFG